MCTIEIIKQGVKGKIKCKTPAPHPCIFILLSGFIPQRRGASGTDGQGCRGRASLTHGVCSMYSGGHRSANAANKEGRGKPQHV